MVSVGASAPLPSQSGREENDKTLIEADRCLSLRFKAVKDRERYQFFRQLGVRPR
jgi:hypothetical protein